MIYNNVRVRIGNFDFLHPGNKEVCLDFDWRPDAPPEVKAKRGLVVWKVGDGDDHFDSALDAMRAAADYVGRCLYNSDKDWTVAALSYLEKMEDQDYTDKLIDERERLNKRLAEIDKLLASCRVQAGAER